jgi:hypothetical protein
MRRSTIGTLVLALAMTTGVARLQAQGFMIGAGASIPSGDFGDAAKTGWVATAGLNFGAKALSFRIDGNYSQVSLKGEDTGSEKLILGLGGVQFGLGQKAAHPYLLGEVGYLHSSFSDCPEGFDCGSGAFAWAAGAGFTTGSIFVEGRYVSSSKDGSTKSMILAEVGLRLGKK